MEIFLSELTAEVTSCYNSDNFQLKMGRSNRHHHHIRLFEVVKRNQQHTVQK